MTKAKYLILAIMLVLEGCTYGRIDLGNGKYTQASAITGQGGTYKVGNPYKIMGKWYYPKEDYSYSEVGVASWYGKDFHAKTTANGEVYDMNSLTAAHRTLPLPSIVKVTNLENGRSLVLRVNDRGPYAKSRIIDVSKRASQLLGFHTQGTTKVRVEIMEKESKALKAALLGDKYQGKIYEAQQTPVTVSEPTPTTASVGQSYPKGSYFVQAGAFSQHSGAQETVERIGMNDNTNIYYVNVDGRNYYRVRVGPFATEKEAQSVLAKMQYRGITEAKIVTD